LGDGVESSGGFGYWHDLDSVAKFDTVDDFRHLVLTLQSSPVTEWSYSWRIFPLSPARLRFQNGVSELSAQAGGHRSPSTCLGSAPFHYIREGFFLGNSLQTRRSFLHVAAKISPMPTVTTDPNSELMHNFIPSFRK